MGNTENVVHNHIRQDDAGFTDAAKANEYVSWYLNGVIGRAEYPYPDLTQNNIITSMENPDDVDKIVNFSGPIKKLLPFSLQNSVRIAEVDKLQSNTVRHDQFIACTHLGIAQVTLPIIGTVYWPSSSVPIECFGSFFNFANQVRMKDDFVGNTPPVEESNTYLYHDQIEFLKAYTKWKGLICLFVKIPLINRTIFYCINGPKLPLLSNLFTYIPFSSTEDRMGDVKLKSILLNASPDFRILYATVSANKADLYFPHMEEDNQLAELLQNTYASKDTDLEGPVSKVYSSTNPYCDLKEVRSNPGDTITKDKNSSTLVVDVNYKAEIYCDFFVGQYNFNGAFCTTSPTADPPGLGGKCVEWHHDYLPRFCSVYYPSLDCGGTYNLCIVDSMCQPLPIDPESKCKALQGQCMPWNWGCTRLLEPPGIPNPSCFSPNYYFCFDPSSCPDIPKTTDPVQQCTKTVNVNIRPETRTPLANELWSQLVAGPAGVFKRIFPEVGEGTPVESIWDIPGASTYTFDCNGANCSIGAPSGNRLANELYFPHVGGIYEYFLRAIQTALRPKGYGHPILSGNPTGAGSGACDGLLFEEIGDPPDLSDKGRQAVTPLLGNLDDELLSAYKAGENETGVPCEVLAGIHWIEAGNDPSKDLQEGAPLNGRTLAESAIQAARELQSKVGINGNFDSFDQLKTALSYYNGGGNGNCQPNDDCATRNGLSYCSDFMLCDSGQTAYCTCSSRFRSGGPAPDPGSCRMGLCGSGYHFTIPYGNSNCPPPAGEDDAAVVNYLRGEDMYLLYEYDCTQSVPWLFDRPGYLTFAIGLYLSEKGRL
jgi:hypothetical protein